MTELDVARAPVSRLRSWLASVSFRVWALVGVLVAAALGVTLGGRLQSQTGSSGHGLVTWWVLAAGVTIAELLPVHLHLRRQTWSASLIEIPLVIGLTTTDPRSVVVGQVVGCLVARGLINRQGIQKLAFNVALTALESSSAVVIYQLMVHGQSVQHPIVWLAAYTAVLVEGVVSTIGITAVMTLVTGALPENLSANTLLGVVAVPALGTALALEASILMTTDRPATALLGLIIGLLVVGYRAYGRLRARYASLQLLHQFTEALRKTPSDRSSITGLLDATRRVLDAETAEVVLAGDDSRLRRWVSGSDIPIEQTPAESSSWLAIGKAPDGLLAPIGTKDLVALQWLTAGGRADGMVVPLQRDGETIGALAVANREGEVATFDRESLRVFQTLANHAAVALQNTELIERLTFEASHDTLTMLGNRQDFRRRLDEQIGRRAPGQKIAVALIDLDRFKEINDTLGHHVGDGLLSWLGCRMATVLPAGAVVARLGGDEFVLFVTFDGTKSDAAGVVDKLLSPLWNEPFVVADVKIDVRASVGVAVVPDDGEDADTLLQRADVAMYEAKSQGNGSIAAYHAERDTNSAEKLALVAELRSAIKDGLLDVHFQPQVDLASGQITSAEALVRWTHSKHGRLSPDEFIPLAERTGLIVPLTELVIDRALRACTAWRSDGLDISVAVNVSVRSLADEGVVATIQRLLAQHGVPPTRLTVEVTESGVMEDEQRNVGVLEALASLGVSVAVDDFGTGYSSLAYLKRLPVNEVKIDKSFVMAMENDPQDAAIVRSVIDLARNLNLAVVAEGVETATAMAVLSELGCTVAQGYHIGRPAPAAEMLDLALRWNVAHDDATRPAGAYLRAFDEKVDRIWSAVG